ncbi:MAG: Gfo/Idh/MocA family oxidoreductase [Clostridia bacterium]|nr:Gfo/Idh/MocA family oxidoreductase [Clostridia bacterium]
MEKKKIGVFGTWRGLAYIKAFAMIDEAEVVAICDKDPEKIEEAKKFCPADVKVVETFDELLDSGIDAVCLCNYFHEHAPYAVKAMKRGIHVFSECTPAATLKQCVELVEAAEESGCIYALAENYPYSQACMEIARVYQSGVLGQGIFAEGEYVHPMGPKEHDHYAPYPEHWRNHNPKTYYCTHAMAPLMAATGLMPKRIIGKVAAKPNGEGKADGAGIMMVEMDNGSVFRVSGSCNFGPHGNWYRLGCEKGGIESLRGTNDKVRVMINEWDQNEQNSMFGTESVYEPVKSELGKKALSTGHSGGDFWVCWHFVQALLGNEKPFMNVYRAVALSSIGILGWRSVLQDSKQLNIPDYSNKQDRDLVRDDDLNPFFTEGKAATLDCALYK